MRKLLWVGITLGLVSCEGKRNQEEHQPFELKPVIAGVYETLQLSEGVESEVLDSCEWPFALAVWNKGLMATSYPHALIGDRAERKPDRPYNLQTLLNAKGLPQSSIELTSGYQSGLFPAPWGGILVGVMPFIQGERLVKGNIWWINDSSAVKLEALGKASFVGLFALQTPNGRAVIYYTDQGNHESYLYKFVADSGADLRNGKVYVCDVHAGNWIPMDVSSNVVLKEKYGNNQKLLANLNEAVHLAGVHMVDPFSWIQMDPINGNILVSAMPQKEKSRMFGGLYQLAEAGGQYDGTFFKASSFVFAGLHLNFTHVSQFLTDSRLNLWVATGIPPGEIGSPEYTVFGGNALMVMPRKGLQSRLMLRLAVAPGKGSFRGLLLDPKKRHIYTFLLSETGKAALLRLKGPAIDGLLLEE